MQFGFFAVSFTPRLQPGAGNSLEGLGTVSTVFATRATEGLETVDTVSRREQRNIHRAKASV
jgi:hypothetical protein